MRLRPLQDQNTGEITFYLKGADVVMANIVQYNDWLEEEVSSIAGQDKSLNILLPVT